MSTLKCLCLLITGHTTGRKEVGGQRGDEGYIRTLMHEYQYSVNMRLAVFLFWKSQMTHETPFLR